MPRSVRTSKCEVGRVSTDDDQRFTPFKLVRRSEAVKETYPPTHSQTTHPNQNIGEALQCIGLSAGIRALQLTGGGLAGCWAVIRRAGKGDGKAPGKRT